MVNPDPNWDYGFLLQKSQPFEKGDLIIIKKFTQALREKLVAAGQPFFPYLLEKCSQEVVSASMQPKMADDSLLPSIIGLLRKWSAETYEGQRISVAIGVDPYAPSKSISNVHLSQFSDRDFAKVLSNGMDTLLVLSLSGHVVEHVAVDGGHDKNEQASEGSVHFPRRHHSIATWATRTRVALVLNRQAEILVFRNGCLQFAFRRGVWSHFSHESMIAKLGTSGALLRAVYATCLDISFARTGGCIAVVDSDKAAKIRDYLSPEDLLANPIADKSKLIRHLAGVPFHQMPRAIREELAAMDGAVLLGHNGQVLAAGAIVSVPGGSDGGGRKAAAKALSRLGLAIKISADGGITAYTKRGSKTKPDVAFELCV